MPCALGKARQAFACWTKAQRCVTLPCCVSLLAQGAKLMFQQTCAGVSKSSLSFTRRSLLLLRAWVQSPVGQRARRTSARTQRSISSSSRGSSSRSSAGACSGCWKQSNTQTHTHSTHTRIPTHTYTASKQNFLFLLFRFQKKKKMKWKRNERRLFQLFCCSSFMCVNEEEQKKERRGRTLANIDNN